MARQLHSRVEKSARRRSRAHQRPARFALGSAYSFLDAPRGDLPVPLVMANSAAGTTEHDESRRWLVRVGALPRRSPCQGQSVPARQDGNSTQGSIAGNPMVGRDAGRAQATLRISMLGTEDSTRSVQRRPML